MLIQSMDVTVDLDILAAIEKTARQSPGRMNTTYRRAVGRLGGRILVSLKVRPEPASKFYPLRWESARQRRYVMAKLRREGNLPYQRTDKLLDSYRVDLVDDLSGGAILEVSNTDPKARFVIGDQVQKMFLQIGWVQMSDVVSDARVEAEDLLIETWFTVADPFAGVPQ
jgi:hypothetical protein